MPRPYSFKGDRTKGSAATGRRRVRAAISEGLTPGFFSESPGPSSVSAARSATHEEDCPPVVLTQTVPKSLVKFIVALFLMPPAWVLTETFLQAFTSSIHHGLLASQSFGCFAAGMLLFGILYLLLPQKALMIPYVLGHEVTHALWVWVFGGKVSDQFHIGTEGGHVLADRINTWIVLAPYFFPIYSLLVVTLYGAASLVEDISAYRWVLFLLIGLTLAFHLVFTCLLIAKGQPDLHYGGTFFSLMVIYSLNLLVITGLLLITSHQVNLATFGRLLFVNTANFVEWCHALASWFMSWIEELSAALGKR